VARHRFVPEDVISGTNKLAVKLDDKFVLLLPNEEYRKRHSSPTQMKASWRKLVRAEVNNASQARRLGLLASDAKMVMLSDGEEKIPALQVPSFDYLKETGVQVRDTNESAANKGDTVIFAGKGDITKEHCLKILEPVVQDAAKIIAADMPFARDSINLAITHAYSPEAGNVKGPASLQEDASAKLRLFLFDFPDPELRHHYNEVPVADRQGQIKRPVLFEHSSKMAHAIALSLGSALYQEIYASRGREEGVNSAMQGAWHALSGPLAEELTERIAKAAAREIEAAPHSLRAKQGQGWGAGV
jgi:hypothetical protein